MSEIRGELSGLSDLPSWLHRMREIAAMPDGEALAQCDALLWSVGEILQAGPQAEEEPDWEAIIREEQRKRWTMILETASARIITTPAAVMRLIGEVDAARAGLALQNALTDDLERAGRVAKVRAAHWRAEQRRELALVAQAGGSEKKAAKLRAEATELLRIDWSKCFPSEPLPTVSDSRPPHLG